VLHGHQQSGASALLERRSGYLLAGQLKQVELALTAITIVRLLKPFRGANKTLH
jgi:hypothetical protein